MVVVQKRKQIVKFTPQKTYIYIYLRETKSESTPTIIIQNEIGTIISTHILICLIYKFIL